MAFTYPAQQSTVLIVLLIAYPAVFINGFVAPPHLISSHQHQHLPSPDTSIYRSTTSSKLTKDSSYHNLPTQEFLNQVNVLDGVFHPDTCLELHYLAEEHSGRSDGSSVFSWGPNSYHDDDDDNKDQCEMLTPLEQALKSVLQELYEEKKDDNVSSKRKWVVEYWSRAEYMNIDTHSDIDERYLLDEGLIQCPYYGHVLYLDVDPRVRGPTCVFSQMGGWQGSSSQTTTLVTVPAVPGRILRFPGSAMHAVPKPATVWLETKEEQEVTLEASDDCDENDDDAIERSVILFNVWLEKGPRGVTEDYISKGGMPDGIQLADEDENDGDGTVEEEGKYAERVKARKIEQWEEDFGADCSDLWCEPRDEWQEVHIATSSEQSSDDNSKIGHLSVRLMGKEARRSYPTKHVVLSAPFDLTRALQDESQPQQFLLVQEEKDEVER